MSTRPITEETLKNASYKDWIARTVATFFKDKQNADSLRIYNSIGDFDITVDANHPCPRYLL